MSDLVKAVPAWLMVADAVPGLDEVALPVTGIILGVAAIGMIGAHDKSQAQLKDDAQTDVCTTCEPPECKDLNEKITQRTNELKKRYVEMRQDDYGLYDIDPAKIPGVGSWTGHVRQFKNKQANLREILKRAEDKKCQISDDSWKWATREPPRKPAPGP